jgi:hypothetical protein
VRVSGSRRGAIRGPKNYFVRRKRKLADCQHPQAVAGDVRIRVADCVNRSYAGAPADRTAWITGDCAVRVIRGGCWTSTGARFNRLAAQWFYAYTLRDSPQVCMSHVPTDGGVSAVPIVDFTKGSVAQSNRPAPLFGSRCTTRFPRSRDDLAVLPPYICIFRFL